VTDTKRDSRFDAELSDILEGFRVVEWGHGWGREAEDDGKSALKSVLTTVDAAARIIPAIREAAMKPSPFTSIGDDPVCEARRWLLSLATTTEESLIKAFCYTLIDALADRDRLAAQVRGIPLIAAQYEAKCERLREENANLRDLAMRLGRFDHPETIDDLLHKYGTTRS